MFRSARRHTPSGRWSPVARYRVVEAVACEQADGVFIHLRLEAITPADSIGWRSCVFLPKTHSTVSALRTDRDLDILGVTWNDITAQGEQAFVGREFTGNCIGGEWVCLRAAAPALVPA